jgi:hypothetical protein
MKDNNEIAEETFKIPLDILIDIIAIIVKEELKHEVIKVVQSRSLIVVAVSYNKNSLKVQKVMQNIQSLISDYEHFRASESEELNWREG